MKTIINVLLHLLLTIIVVLNFVSSSVGYLSILSFQLLLCLLVFGLLLFLYKDCNRGNAKIYYVFLTLISVFFSIQALIRILQL